MPGTRTASQIIYRCFCTMSGLGIILEIPNATPFVAGKMNEAALLAIEPIASRILVLRDLPVILDATLAAPYAFTEHGN
jgi:hypothetical protein